MRVALSGGTGFLGRYVERILDGAGLDVCTLTRANVDGSAFDTRISTDYSTEDLTKHFQGIDAVVHLAAHRSGTNDVEDHLPSMVLTDHVYKASALAGVKQVVFASSISVYASRAPQPWGESDETTPNLMYGVTKLSGEILGNRLEMQTGIKVTNLRLAHLFGFDERNNYMINRFMRLAFNKKEIALNAPSHARRDFLYAKDAARSVLLSLEHGTSGTFNIGSNTAISNSIIGNTINLVFQNPHPLIVRDDKAHEGITSSQMEGSLARKVLGYRSNFSFEDALIEIREQMKGLEYVPLHY